jgi:hypothetical protein
LGRGAYGMSQTHRTTDTHAHAVTRGRGSLTIWEGRECKERGVCAGRGGVGRERGGLGVGFGR